ncbi:hypothetical protein SMACR_04689 [Sordaria macrospora]|uniref:Uncharacterized protein n=1 Tax=Sordaria macrospora TaxID=5147 RepID=A0A8S8ZS27_SORMA|nr:hypothetical protein SMACR_04689 [Sordaria macrospora]WPJ61960.1 hypothetical protein SMAC4_04689 [Sordaria macrospora]
MGGLVVKKAYMMALLDTKYKRVSDCIASGAVIFLGTPHRGSESATSVHRILSATIGSKAFVQELMRNSSTLTAINEDFRHYAADLSIWSFHETQPTTFAPGKSAIVVERSSAILEYENEISSHIDADHHTICKFESREDPGYTTLKNLLAHVIQSTTERSGELNPLPEAVQKRETYSASVAPGQLTSKQLSQILGYEDSSEEDLLFQRDSRAVYDSCSWICEKEAYQQWREPDNLPKVQYLWLKGQPGTGKSVLMSSVVDQLQDDNQLCVYYFFRENSAAKRTTRSFLLSTLAQMVACLPEFYNHLAEMDKDHAKIQSMSTRLLWQKLFLGTLFMIKQPQPWFWVIDGLDEAERPSEIISLIGRIQNNTKSQIKIIIASRAGMELERDFQKLNLGAALQQEVLQPADTKADMIAYASQQLELLPFDEDEREEIISLVVEKSQGIFLWLKLALEEILATAHTKDGIYEALEAMPMEMTDLYEQIVDGMSKSLRPASKPLAKAILQYTVCSIRPLKSTELQTVLEPQFGRLINLNYTINQTCPHLVKMEETTSIVNPIHSTLREFLLQGTHSEFAVDEADGHQSLFKIFVGTSMKKWDDCLAHINVGKEGEVCKSLESRRIQHGERVGAIKIDTAGDRLVTGGSKFILVWDIKTGEVVVRLLNRSEARCQALAFHPHNKKLVSVSADNISVWDLKRRDRRKMRISKPGGESQRRHRGAPWGVSIDSECQRVALAYKGWPLEVWDIDTGKLLTTFPTRNPLNACFNPSGHEVYSVNEDGTITRFWLNEGQPHGSDTNTRTQTLTCNANGTLIAGADGDGCIRIFSSDSFELLYSMDKYDEPVTAMAFNPAGDRLYDIRASDCNIWVPEVLLINVRDNESSSEESETIRLPITTSLESARAIHEITVITTDKAGDFVCCGKSNGRISIYDTKTGKELQEIYKHERVHVSAVVWSSDAQGQLIASGDTSGRIMIVSLRQLTPKSWACQVRVDFRLDRWVDGGVRQLIFNDDGTRLLVSAQNTSSLWKIPDGSMLGERRILGKKGDPAWVTHPHNRHQLVMIGPDVAGLYGWEDFEELTTPQQGIQLIQDQVHLGNPWQLQDDYLRARVHVTQDKRHFVTTVSAPSRRSSSAKVSFWPVSGFGEGHTHVQELYNLNDVHIHSLAGVYQNRAVFLDGDLWVCTMAAQSDNERTEEGLGLHFYVSTDWLNTSEEEPSIVTPVGDFVYAKRGKLVVVQRGMKCKQDLKSNSPSLF